MRMDTPRPLRICVISTMPFSLWPFCALARYWTVSVYRPTQERPPAVIVNPNSKSTPPEKQRSLGAPYPRFPVDVGGANELHAAFRGESRTRCCLSEPLAGNPGISLLLARCGSTTTLNRKLCGRPRSREKRVRYGATQTSWSPCTLTAEEFRETFDAG